MVRCAGCRTLVRRRLSERERARALAWRWAAAQFVRDPSIERRRQLRGGADERVAVAMRRVAEMLLGESGLCTGARRFRKLADRCEPP